MPLLDEIAEAYPSFVPQRPRQIGYGPRIDGTEKGPGFAAQYLPNGSIMTEYSAGDRNFLYPSVYQDITPWDMETLRNAATYGYDPLQEEVYDRAYTTALMRAMQGLSPFWTPQDGQPGAPYTPIIW